MNRDMPRISPKPNGFVQALRDWRDRISHPEREAHHEVLEHLGAAVIMKWAYLPREVQRDLFDAAVDLREPKADVVRQHIAVFLHHHKDDARTFDGGGEA